MKAIICDTCGKSVPDTSEADIMPLYINYGFPVKHIERDICSGCLEKLVGFFDPEQLKKEVTTLVPATVPDWSKEEVKEISNLIVSTIAESSDERVVKANFEVEHANVDGHHLKFQPAEDIREMKTILCANCNKPFQPKTKKEKCCGKKCGQQKWYKEQKLKNETPEKKKIRTDALLKKLKSENPVKRNDERPSIYREM